MRGVLVTAAERVAAAEAIVALSQRIAALAEIDRADDESATP